MIMKRNLKDAITEHWDYISCSYNIQCYDAIVSESDKGRLAGNRKIRFIPILGAALAIPANIKRKMIESNELPDELFANECSKFYKKICMYCDEKKIDETELYKQARVSRAVFSKIRNMGRKPYVPGKTTILCLCIALQLKLPQAQELLSILGYALSNEIIVDKVIAWCMEQEDLIYTVDSINEVLYDRTKGACMLIDA